MFQSTNPTERIVSVGDYNAFQFNDGYVDSIGTIKGTPAPADQVLLPSDDLVNPNLVDLVDTAPADQRYSFIFDGNAQELDHVLVTQNLVPLSNGLSCERNNADFPRCCATTRTRPSRLSRPRSARGVSFSFPEQTTTQSEREPADGHVRPADHVHGDGHHGRLTGNPGTVTFTEGSREAWRADRARRRGDRNLHDQRPFGRPRTPSPLHIRVPAPLNRAQRTSLSSCIRRRRRHLSCPRRIRPASVRR